MIVIVQSNATYLLT